MTILNASALFVTCLASEDPPEFSLLELPHVFMVRLAVDAEIFLSFEALNQRTVSFLFICNHFNRKFITAWVVELSVTLPVVSQVI